MSRWLFTGVAAAAVQAGASMTRINIVNEWGGGMQHADLNVKIHGEGIGGCDIIMHPAGAEPTYDNSSCECLWGTVNYELTVWLPAGSEDSELARKHGSIRGVVGGSGNKTTSLQEEEEDGVNGTALPFCSDTRGLGNCYGGPYTCTIGADKLCHCE